MRSAGTYFACRRQHRASARSAALTEPKRRHVGIPTSPFGARWNGIEAVCRWQSLAQWPRVREAAGDGVRDAIRTAARSRITRIGKHGVRRLQSVVHDCLDPILRFLSAGLGCLQGFQVLLS